MKEALETVEDLTARGATYLVCGVWSNPDARKTAQQLLYYALEKDKHCEFARLHFAMKSDQFVGMPVAVSLSEYVMNTLSWERQREYVFRHWQRLLFRLGLLIDATGMKATDDVGVLTGLSVDKEGYANYLARGLAPGQSGEGAFNAAHIWLGVQNGLLRHKELGTSFSSEQFEECYHSERFEKTEAYSAFLKLPKQEVCKLLPEDELVRPRARGHYAIVAPLVACAQGFSSICRNLSRMICQF